MSSNNDESRVTESTPAPITSIHQKEDTAQRSPEMTTIQSGSAASAAVVQPTSSNSLTRERTSSDRPHTPYGPVRTDTTTALAQAQAAPPQSPPPATLPPSQRTRAQSTAIGPSTDQSEPVSKNEEQTGPRLELTLLLTNGARHPFILDSKYLAKRNADVPGDDPFNLSVYKLKELILREWREEWEQKPSSPSYIRLISFGKLLDDKTALKGIVHGDTHRDVD